MHCSLRRRTFVASAAAVLAISLVGPTARADDATTIHVTIKDHKFTPSEIHVPADKPSVLVVKNEDATPEEFESSELKIEKMIAGGKQVTIRLRPLAKGSYPFKGEFHHDTAKGVVIAE
jgi:heme/copper-type cytochrome/quinol oxidase subunit 2